jgi:lysine 2,3-aminomutase
VIYGTRIAIKEQKMVQTRTDCLFQNLPSVTPLQGVSLDDWNDWRWQLRNRIGSVEALLNHLSLSEQERTDIQRAGQRFRWALTPYCLRTISPNDEKCPIRMQQIPTGAELYDTVGSLDPLSEKTNSPVDSVVHVYPDRVAFKVTNVCPTYCRYCFREYFVGDVSEARTHDALHQGIAYIASNTKIRDVLLTGGDPLLLSTDRIRNLLDTLSSISHVEILRIGTRTPSTLPQRIDDELCETLASYHPLWLNTHFNHPKEITRESAAACMRLVDHGIPVGNQSVLLRGINDSLGTMKDLMQLLLRIRVRPYYIYQCQNLQGTAHLRVPIEIGLEIMRGLRGYTTGFGNPTYVLDTPYGKVPLNESYIVGRSGDDVIVKSFDGREWREYNPIGDHKVESSITI